MFRISCTTWKKIQRSCLPCQFKIFETERCLFISCLKKHRPKKPPSPPPPLFPPPPPAQLPYHMSTITDCPG